MHHLVYPVSRIRKSGFTIFRLFITVTFLSGFPSVLYSQTNKEFVKSNYIKQEVYIPMRDGVRLFTAIYQPKDSSVKYPILMERTPYSIAPYGEKNYPAELGPNPELMQEKYIFVYQDVRGRYMSEGDFEEMTPHIANKKSDKDTDESSDAYDTIEWLLKNLKNHNGNAGIWGISYPGFYASASLPGAHPALKAVSPQAPVTDEFIGDDANHKGAFFLMDNFSFLNYFDKPRNGPVESYGSQLFPLKHNDAYSFFLELGPLSNSNKAEYYNNRGKIWNEYLAHDTYDEYWKSRNIRTHLNNISPAVLVVGGWYDAENLFGALETYRAIESTDKAKKSTLVMGPWTHGAWARSNWSSYAGTDYNQNTALHYQQTLETPFFNYYLKNKGTPDIPEAYIFETGSNTWKTYNSWPPENAVMSPWYLQPGGHLSHKKPSSKRGFTGYTSDPSNPVPYTGKTGPRRNNEYMAEDQRFVSERPDVISFTSETLTADLTISGKIMADLWVSTSGTDADFIVKLIDVSAEDSASSQVSPVKPVQKLVRAEVIRGKFRNDFSKPEPFVPGKPSKLVLEMPDAAHTFKKGHRVMIQIQSSWFPLVDRNPQKFMRIPDAKPADFIPASIRVFHNESHPSAVLLPVLKQD